DLDGMAEVAGAIEAPVIADESVQNLADLRRVLEKRAAGGVNLKLAKSGGPLRAIEIGRAARVAGLRIMCGGMVETRLGMTAAARAAPPRRQSRRGPTPRGRLRRILCGVFTPRSPRRSWYSTRPWQNAP